MEERLNPYLPDRTMDRRAFLKISGLLGIGIFSAGLVPVTAEAAKFNKRMYKVSDTRLAMGTFVSMTLIHPSRDEAQDAMGLAFEEIDRLSALLSRFDQSTALSLLNRDGYLKDAPPELFHVIKRSLGYYKLSRGAFDVTVKPIVDLFQESVGAKGKLMPPRKRLREAAELVGSDKVVLVGKGIEFKKPGMGITLDGVAKGYIVDRASDLLAKKGIRNHLVNAGGDIMTRGTKAGNKPWTIAIEDPLKKGNYPDLIQLSDGGVATSGNYEVYFDKEKMFHHIVDPRTGLSPELSTSVSVRAGSAMEADALATGVFVMEPEAGTALVNSLPRCESLVIARNGTLWKSKGW